MPLRLLALALVTLLLGSVMVLPEGASASPGRPAKCDRFDRERAYLQASDRGEGPRVVVIGDSFSAGTGLVDRLAAWPSRLPGRVHVDGHAGSGFSDRSSPCGRKYAYQWRTAAATAGGANLVVVQGGINEWDRTNAEISDGFARIAARLAGRRMIVVGPVMAARFSAQVLRVDRVLRAQSRNYGVRYLSMIGMELPFLADGVHLAPEGHVLFGDRVSAAVSSMLPPSTPTGPSEPSEPSTP